MGKDPALGLFLKTLLTSVAKLFNSWLLAGNYFPIGQTFWECKLLKGGFSKKKCAVFSQVHLMEYTSYLYILLCPFYNFESQETFGLEDLIPPRLVGLDSCDVTAWTSTWRTSIKTDDNPSSILLLLEDIRLLAKEYWMEDLRTWVLVPFLSFICLWSLMSYLIPEIWTLDYLSVSQR